MYTVYISQRSTEEWCENCRYNSAFYCDYNKEYYSDDIGSVQMANGDTWSEYAFHDHGGRCERTGRKLPYDDLVDVVIDDCGGTEQWGPHAVDRSTWECEHSGDTISDDVGRVRVEGEDWAPHTAEREAFVSDLRRRVVSQRAEGALLDGRVVARVHEDEAREASTALVVYKPKHMSIAKRLTLTGDDPGQLVRYRRSRSAWPTAKPRQSA